MSWTDGMPELERITDPDLRRRTRRVFETAARRGGWPDPGAMPYVEETASGGEPTVRNEVTLLQHVRLVAAAAADMAERCVEVVGASVNVDHVVAGGLLHDVGLLEMFEPTPQGPRLRGPLLLRHPVVGARLAAEEPLPEEIVHIIVTHSVEGEFTVRTPEAVLVHWADWCTYDVMRATLFPWVPQERASYYFPAGAFAGDHAT